MKTTIYHNLFTSTTINEYIYDLKREHHLQHSLTIPITSIRVQFQLKYQKATIPWKNLFNSLLAMKTSRWLTGPHNTMANIQMGRTSNTYLMLNIMFTRKSFLVNKLFRFKTRDDDPSYSFRMNMLAVN